MKPKTITSKALFIFIVGTLFYCYEYFLQVAPAPITAYLMEAFHANATQLGLISGFFFYAYTIFQIPSGLLVDRYGARIILTLVILIGAFGTLLFSFASTILIAALARFIIGTGSAFAFVCSLYLISRWFPSYYFALMVGIAQFLSGLGAVAGEAPLAILIKHFGWQHTLWMLVIIGFILAMLTLFFVRNQPKDEHVTEDTRHAPSVLTCLKMVLSKSQTWWLALYGFCSWTAMTGFAALWGVPFLMTSLHISTLHAAEATSWVWIGMAVSNPITGWFSAHIGRRCLPLTLTAFIGFISLLLVLYWTPSATWALWTLLFLIGVSASSQSVLFATVQDITAIEYTGTANGFINMAVVFSGAFLQPLIGKLLDLNWYGTFLGRIPIYNLHAYHIALFILPVCFLIAILITVFFIKETYCKSMKN